ncbi:MAG: bifunctional 4-hydroxy-2-oxoglutarate aldolase/2-dehydro-3-deoxy-phosphogluconate aldolase, partial [Candidatus Acidiferrales bacterium]
MEVTFTVADATGAIAELAKRYQSEEILIGAGTVLDAEAARRCLDAGAQFIVSPGIDLETMALVLKEGKVMMPGALSPSEIISAWRAGADFVKVFPCGAVGGAKYIKALKGPLPQIPLVPTGGVNLETAADFILAGSEALGVGGELVQTAALKAGKPEVIAEAARKFIEIVQQARASRESR